MKKIILLLLIFIVITGCNRHLNQVTYWRATSMYSAIDDKKAPIVLNTEFYKLSLINKTTEEIVLGGIPIVKYDSRTEIRVIKDKKPIHYYTAIDFEGDYCTLSTTLQEDYDGILFLLIGMHYEDIGGIYFKFYPTQKTIKFLKRRLVL